VSAADPIAILGSGMAGCGAAHRLHQSGVRSVMYDKNAYYGGHTSSHQFPGGWTFDEGPHVSFTKEKRLQDLFAENVGGEFQRLATYVNNYWRGHWIKHPAQCNLHGLPTELVVRVLRDFIDAQARRGDAVVENYEDWLRASYGDTFAETFPMEYTVKYHTTTASNLNTGWIGPRLYQANLEEVLRGALEPSTADVHYISDFRYPTRGGFASYLAPFMRQTELRLSHEVVQIDPRARTLRFANGATARYADLISSVPLPELVPMIEGAPADVRRAAALLACTEVVIVCLGIDRPDLLDAHWTYFYDRDVFFTRLSTPHLQSPHTVPPGCGSLQAECYYSPKYRPRDVAPEDCIEPVIRDLRRCGVLRDTDRILFRHAMHIPYANVIFDLDCDAALATVHAYLEEIGIAWCGRYGDWAYIWTDQSFLSGENAAQKVLDGRVRRAK
jgi:protoporphyrinogen oxidase